VRPATVAEKASYGTPLVGVQSWDLGGEEGELTSPRRRRKEKASAASILTACWLFLFVA
jgi:hypothetical protein